MNPLDKENSATDTQDVILEDSQTESQESNGNDQTRQKDAKEEASSPSGKSTDQSTGQIEDSGKGPAKPQSVEEPWHKSERFRKITEKNRQLEERLEAISGKYEQMLENQAKFNNALGGRPQGQPLNPEEEQRLLTIFEAAASVPAIAQKYGLGSSNELKTQIEQMKMERMQEQHDFELDKVVSKYASKFGFEEDDLRERYRDLITDEALFGNRDYRPGIVETAFRHMLFENLSDLKERETNLKLIQEKKAKKTQGVESTSKGPSSKNVKLEKNLSDYLDRREKEEGGMVFE